MLRPILFIFLCVFLTTSTSAQSKTGFEIIAKTKVDQLFPDSTLAALNIRFPIYRVYKYFDKSGTYYCVLTENRKEITSEGDTIKTAIRAINLKKLESGYEKIWEINDKIDSEMHGEKSVWFWTKYVAFTDFDKDGLIEPIIIYGTAGNNNYDDGRIKFIIYHKGKKVAIRHQNGVLDDERDTQVDKSFYSLPIAMQNLVQQKMKLMMDNNHAIFPHGWEKAMKAKKTFFSERVD